MLVIVLGILAGIVTFAVGSFRDTATESACAADARTLATANAAYAAKHGGKGAPTDDVLVAEGYLGSLPSSGVELEGGEVDTSGCGTEPEPEPEPELALTPEEPALAETLTIATPVTVRQNASKGKATFSGSGASAASGVLVQVFDNVGCVGDPKAEASGATAADGSWGPTAPTGSLDDARDWWAKAGQPGRASACTRWSMPNFAEK